MERLASFVAPRAASGRDDDLNHENEPPPAQTLIAKAAMYGLQLIRGKQRIDEDLAEGALSAFRRKRVLDQEPTHFPRQRLFCKSVNKHS